MNGERLCRAGHWNWFKTDNIIQSDVKIQFAKPSHKILGEVVPIGFCIAGLYDKKWRGVAREAAEEVSVARASFCTDSWQMGIAASVREGVLTMSGGPNYESAAELRMFSMLGADCVGMSSIPGRKLSVVSVQLRNTRLMLQNVWWRTTAAWPSSPSASSLTFAPSTRFCTPVPPQTTRQKQFMICFYIQDTGFPHQS